MNRVRLIAVAGLCFILSTSRLAAAPFYRLPPISVVQYSGYANDVFTATFKDRQVNFEIDLEKGRGFFDGQEGVLVVPIKDLSEDRIDKASGTRIGAPVCHLFWGPGLKPLANGKPIDKSKLRSVKALEYGGEESDTTCFVCTVRRSEGNNLELCLYGTEKEPVFTARLEKVQAQNPTDFECNVTAVNRDQALAITLFGKYEATLTFAVDPTAHRPPDDSMTARFGVSPRKSLSAPMAVAKKAPAGTGGSIGSQLQFDVQRSGYWRNGDTLPKAATVIWKFPPEEEANLFVPGTPVVDHGVLYFGDNQGNFHALNTANGKEKWVRSYKGERMVAAPAIADSVAFIATNSDLKCVSLEKGELRWSSELPASMGETPPLVVGDAVFVAGGDGVYAFKRTDGHKIWSHNTLDDRPVVTPTFQAQFDNTGGMRPLGSASDGSLLFQTVYDQCRVVALDCGDGKQRWSYSSRGWLTAHPVVSGNSVLFGGYDLYVHCVDGQTGKEIWKSPTAASVVAAPAVANGCVYFTAENSRVHCVDLETGKRIWMYRMDRAAEGVICVCAPLVSDKMVFLGSTTGFVFALDALSGEFKWGLPLANRCQVSGAGFATDGKRLFVATRGIRFPQNGGAVFAVGDP
jgi:outer membrane protein assembly factor BamB